MCKSSGRFFCPSRHGSRRRIFHFILLSLRLEFRYGVMVALQILVLSAQVRILVPQLLSGGDFRGGRSIRNLNCLNLRIDISR